MIRKLSYSIIGLLAFTALFSACEKDDMCLEPATPKLVIRFYDMSNQDEIKPVEDLQVVATGVADTLKYTSKDSIAIPLDVNTDVCQFKFISAANPDVLEFSYQREEVFISKTCGYRTYFVDLFVENQPDADNWIKQIDILDNYIKIDTLAHVKIYH